MTFSGADIWKLGKVDHKYLESFKMWYWRRMEEISWTDRVRNEELIGHKLRRNCLVTHVIEGKIERKCYLFTNLQTTLYFCILHNIVMTHGEKNIKNRKKSMRNWKMRKKT
jgi:hypothetical protein